MCREHCTHATHDLPDPQRACTPQLTLGSTSTPRCGPPRRSSHSPPRCSSASRSFSGCASTANTRRARSGSLAHPRSRRARACTRLPSGLQGRATAASGPARSLGACPRRRLGRRWRSASSLPLQVLYLVAIFTTSLLCPMLLVHLQQYRAAACWKRPPGTGAPARYPGFLGRAHQASSCAMRLGRTAEPFARSEAVVRLEARVPRARLSSVRPTGADIQGPWDVAVRAFLRAQSASQT